MFENYTSFNEDIGIWETQNITNMSKMFKNATSFNDNIDAWDVSSVTNMFGCSVARHPLINL